MNVKSILFQMAVLGMSACLFTTGCKEDGKVLSPLSNQEVAQAQDEESQDAMSESIEQSVDNSADALESNNFSSLKAGVLNGISYTVTNTSGSGSSSDTTIFPKTVTLNYSIDTTVNGENLSMTGTIQIKVELTQAKKPWRNYIKRTITFTNFSMANDSNSFTINGTRTVKRLSIKSNPTIITLNTKNLSLIVKDSITSNLSFQITSGNFSGSFTRKANRIREAIAHFEKGYFWHATPLKDTIKLSGSVTGTNLLGDNYTREITSPITITPCVKIPFNPVVSSGNLRITNPKRTIELTYASDECRTKVTITKDDKVSVIERKLKRRYNHWW